MFKKIYVFFLFIMLCGIAYSSFDLYLFVKQPVGVVKKSGTRVRISGINFWPLEKHWPPFCYNVKLGDRELNLNEFFKQNPNIIDKPTYGFCYIDEIIME